MNDVKIREKAEKGRLLAIGFWLLAFSFWLLAVIFNISNHPTFPTFVL